MNKRKFVRVPGILLIFTFVLLSCPAGVEPDRGKEEPPVIEKDSVNTIDLTEGKLVINGKSVVTDFNFSVNNPNKSSIIFAPVAFDESGNFTVVMDKITRKSLKATVKYAKMGWKDNWSDISLNYTDTPPAVRKSDYLIIQVIAENGDANYYFVQICEANSDATLENDAVKFGDPDDPSAPQATLAPPVRDINDAGDSEKGNVTIPVPEDPDEIEEDGTVSIVIDIKTPGQDTETAVVEWEIWDENGGKNVVGEDDWTDETELNVRDGDYIYIKVTPTDGSDPQYYLIEVKVGNGVRHLSAFTIGGQNALIAGGNEAAYKAADYTKAEAQQLVLSDFDGVAVSIAPAAGTGENTFAGTIHWTIAQGDAAPVFDDSNKSNTTVNTNIDFDEEDYLYVQVIADNKRTNWYKAQVVGVIVRYTVSFDINYTGGANPPNVTEVVPGASLGTSFSTPTRPLYHFDGWYDGDVKYSAATPITKDVTLRAVWADKFTLGNGAFPAYGFTIPEGETLGTYTKIVASYKVDEENYGRAARSRIMGRYNLSQFGTTTVAGKRLTTLSTSTNAPYIINNAYASMDTSNFSGPDEWQIFEYALAGSRHGDYAAANFPADATGEVWFCVGLTMAAADEDGATITYYATDIYLSNDDGTKLVKSSGNISDGRTVFIAYYDKDLDRINP
jgi:hypothetical protein